MNASLTTENKRLLKALLQLGRWGNESEIIRYGLHLVAREVQAEQERSLAPIPPGVLARAYKMLSSTDFAEDRAMAEASAYPHSGELDA
jgi:Arc/MetJ-type ribon-helix-helix transcriptional regulator